MTVACFLYVVGVMIGLAWSDARPIARAALAVLWPLGPAAFIITIAVLLAASLIAFPWFGAALVAASVVLWALL